VTLLGNDSIIAMTREDLGRLVEEAIRSALGTWAPPRYLDQAEAADYLAVTVETIRRWRRKGLPHYVLPSSNSGTRGILLFKRRDLDAWARRFKKP